MADGALSVPSLHRDGRGMARLALGALAVGGTAIALSPIFVRLSELGPTATAFHRVFLAVPVLLVWLKAEESGGASAVRPAGSRDRLLLALAGLCFAGDLAFWHWSIKLTSVANATLFANCNSVFVTLGAFLFFGERVRPLFLGALAIALAGAAVLMSESLTLSRVHLTGDALGIVTAVFYAGYFLIVRRLRGRFSTATIMAWTAVATSLVLLPVALASGEDLLPLTAYGWAVLLGLALVSHVTGQGTIAFALAHLPASFSSVALLIQPLMAAVFAWVLLGERLSPTQAFGGLVILAGIVLARRAS
jgi:drug/metabolite transporter (DMT)-like permease